MKKNWTWISSKWFRWTISIIISLGAIYLAIRGVDLLQVFESLKNAKWAFVLLALGGLAINLLAKTFRWKVLVGAAGQKISNLKYLMVMLSGQMLNTLFPARLGDFARAYSLGGMGPGRTFVLGTIVLEKMFDSLAYIALFGVLFVLIPLPEWVGGSIIAFMIVTLTIAAGILLFVFFPTPFIRLFTMVMKRLPEKMRAWLTPRIESGLSSLEVIRRNDDMLRLVLWTALIWGTALVINHLVLLAFDIHLPLTASLLLLIGLQAGISLPAIPGAIGLFEYICVLALSVFGIEQSVALSYGLLLHALIFIPSILAGMISFWALGLSGQRQNFRDGIV